MRDSFVADDARKDVLDELQEELRRKEHEIEQKMKNVEQNHYVIKDRREIHHQFIKDRDRERQAFQVNQLGKEMDKLKQEEMKSFDVEILRKSYFNMLLNSYDVERGVLNDQRDRMQQQNELEKRYREMDVVYAQNKLKMGEVADRVKVILSANQRGLANQYLMQKIEHLQNVDGLKRDLMLGEAAIKFDFLKEKEEVTRLKKRMYEKYQLGKGKNLQKYMKEQKRYLEDDNKINTDEITASNDEGDGEPHLTKLAKEVHEKIHHMNYSLSEEDSEIKANEPVLKIKMGLSRPKMNNVQTSKQFYIKIIKAVNLPNNASITKAEIKIVNLSNKSVCYSNKDHNSSRMFAKTRVANIRSGI